MPDVQQQIARLESLLSRIRVNAAKARVAAPVAVAVAPERDDELDDYASAPDSGPPTDRADMAEDQASASPTLPPAPIEELSIPVEVEELDMADAEMVELSVEAPVAVETAEAESSEEMPAPFANELVEEPAPESAPRPAAQAQAGEEADLEPPVKTPPPESGRQVVASPVGISGEMELEEAEAASLEPDLSGAAISQAPSNEPSVAQLGETVELEGADGPPARIELLSAPMSMPADEPVPVDDLELALPQRQFGGGYQVDLAPPSRAAADLARHREQAEVAQNPPTEPPTSLASDASPRHEEAAVLAAPVAVIAMDAVIAPQELATSPLIVERPSLGSVPVAEMRRSAPATLPDTFVELLDASLTIEA
jgi:hypothetical protein